MCILLVAMHFGCNSKESYTKITEIEENSRIFEVNYQGTV